MSDIEQQRQKVTYKQYQDEYDLPMVMSLVDNELSEPYSIFTYRYFLKTWPHLTFMSFDEKGHCFGCIVAKMDIHKKGAVRGYIAMLVVEKEYRYLGVGSELVSRVIEAMAEDGCEEVVLEAEVTNLGALRLYEKLGFLRDKRLQRYYLNGSDAYRLKLLLPKQVDHVNEIEDAAQQLQNLSVAVN